MILLQCDVCKNTVSAPLTGTKRGETPTVTLACPEWVPMPLDARLGTFVGLRLCSAKCARVVVDVSPTLVLVNPPPGPPYSTHPQVGRLLALDEFDDHWKAGDLNPTTELALYVGWTEHPSVWDRATGEFIRGRPHRTPKHAPRALSGEGLVSSDGIISKLDPEVIPDHVVATGGELEGWTIEPQYLVKIASAQTFDVTGES